ncbi:MAG: GatB/YqeY domain-containing protein [Bacilli bacterium]
MRQRILDDLLFSLKKGQKDVLSVLRMVKGAMQLEEIKLKRSLNDLEMISILSHEIKIRKEANEEFIKGDRQDLINKNIREIDILSEYLPKQLTIKEINQIVEHAIEIVKPISIKDMGKIMSLITPQLKGKADMADVSKMIKGKLNSL